MDILEGGKDLIHEPLVMHRFELEARMDDISHGGIAAVLNKVNFVEMMVIGEIK